MKTFLPEAPLHSNAADALASKNRNLKPGTFVFAVGPDNTPVRVDVRTERFVRIRGKEPKMFSTRRARRMAEAAARKLK